MKRLLLLLSLPCLLSAAESLPGWSYEETRRIPAVEARQGVAADSEFLYAIGNHYIGKYRKDTGERVAHWECPEDEPLRHVNAGIVINGELFGSHSNYPHVPHRSSVEVWDTETLTHKRSIDFGETDGSLTWIDRREGNWIACFVHYAGRGGVPGRGPEFTRLVEFDDNWKEVREWKLPQSVIKDLSSRGYSLSGGAIGPGGLLYVTGHDDQVLHVIRFPESGDQLEDVGEIPISAEGQAFAWDPVEPGVIHMILKRNREIITGRVHTPVAARPVVTIASLKLIPVAYDKAGNYARFEQFAREAAAAGAGIILTSEGYLDGYLGHKKMHPEMTHEKLWEIAETVDGPYVQQAAALAKELSVHIVFCFSERRGEKVFNTAALVGPEGRVLGTYSKSHTGGVEWYEPGSEFPVWDTPVGRIGILICFDRQMPETGRMLGLKGAEMILIPAHSPVVDRINEDVMMRVRAFENNAFVVLANPFNTLVSNPWGEIIAQNTVRDEQGIIYAKLDLGTREDGRGAIDGRRPELYEPLSKPR